MARIFRKLAQLLDVDLTSTPPEDGDALTYDADNEVWVPGAAGGGGSGEALQMDVGQTGHGLSVGDVVLFDGSDFALAQADVAANAEVVGIVAAVADADNFTLHFGGYIDVLSGLTPGATYFLDPAVAGAVTATPPSGGDVSKPLLIAVSTTAAFFFNFRGIVTAGGGAADEASVYPSRVLLLPWTGGPGGQIIPNGVTDANWTKSAPAGDYPWGTVYNSAQNDRRQWALSLRAGTWRVTLRTWTYDGGGIFTFYINHWGDGPTHADDLLTASPYSAGGATADTYSVASTRNVEVEVCDDLTIPEDGDYALLIAVDTKNASSSGYASNVEAIVLERIGA